MKRDPLNSKSHSVNISIQESFFMIPFLEFVRFNIYPSLLIFNLSYKNKKAEKLTLRFCHTTEFQTDTSSLTF